MNDRYSDMVDPGFHRGGDTSPWQVRGGGVPEYHFAKFSQNLHGIKKNLDGESRIKIFTM